MKALGVLAKPSRFIFFTGKGGVGKTSIATAVALGLVEAGKKVLLVSTDAASNLDEMLGIALKNTPVAVPAAAGFFVLNIDPNNAAEAYRARVLEQMLAADAAEKATVREQLSGACTTEIAAFDEFAALLSEPHPEYDHVVFDTAPTGHTLRLLSLPKAWSGFLQHNDQGASCLGPHSGLKLQERKFRAALAALSDPAQTTIVLVTRPETSAMLEAARTAEELIRLGLANQRLMINGVFHACDPTDAVAVSLQQLGVTAMATMPPVLRALACDKVPLKAFDMLGIPALKSLLSNDDDDNHGVAAAKMRAAETLPELSQDYASIATLADALAAYEQALIMVMGKGGVGKTTLAAALALGLVARGKTVHLSTTDPAAHIVTAIDENIAGLQVDCIDPQKETEKYIAKIMESKGAALNSAEKALLLEDLQSPCTEEVAVFHAFAKIVSEARHAFVVLDTAPTGHSLLLMDATGAYHRQALRDLHHTGMEPAHILTPLMRLQDATYTHIILVSLPETTPISQACALQEDLRRAHIEPFAWVVNKTLLASGTHDPLLNTRMRGEAKQLARIQNGLAKQLFVLPWQATPPVGVAALSRLTQQ